MLAYTSFYGRSEKAKKRQFWCTILCRMIRKFSTISPNYASIVHEQKNNDHQIRFIAPIRSYNQSISSTDRKPYHTSKAFHGQVELDSHADTTVAGRNCTVLNQTERSCDMAPFSYTYQPMKNVDNVLADTGFTSVPVQQYILVFHEDFYMTKLDHNLINSNQLRQLQIQVPDNPYHATEPMNITNPSGDFIACLEFQGKIYSSTPSFQLR